MFNRSPHESNNLEKVLFGFLLILLTGCTVELQNGAKTSYDHIPDRGMHSPAKPQPKTAEQLRIEALDKEPSLFERNSG